MPWEGLEITVPAFQWAKTVHTLDSAATVIGSCLILLITVREEYKLWRSSLPNFLQLPIASSLWGRTQNKETLKSLLPRRVPASLPPLSRAGCPKQVVFPSDWACCVLQLITPHDALCGSSRGLRCAQNSERRTVHAIQTLNINIRIRSNVCYDPVRTLHWLNIAVLFVSWIPRQFLGYYIKQFADHRGPAV
jgi:hypothetical protein